MTRGRKTDYLRVNTFFVFDYKVVPTSLGRERAILENFWKTKLFPCRVYLDNLAHLPVQQILNPQTQRAMASIHRPQEKACGVEGAVATPSRTSVLTVSWSNQGQQNTQNWRFEGLMNGH